MRKDECKALEENYMNCMLQKVLKDKVLNNRCRLDSVLWFHLECPLDVAKFDDPIHLKRKWRNFFAETKATAELLMVENDEEKRMRSEYGHIPYPEDAKEKVSVRAFPDEFKHLSPLLHDDLDIDEDEDDSNMQVRVKDEDRGYGKKIPGFESEGEKIDLLSSKFGADQL